MADNRKYYYLKLKENFFDSDSIVLLEDIPLPPLSPILASTTRASLWASG